ncbi:hypothetical protein CFP56_001078 [Quercus suber]|uniref:Uncharacterized protein n=1 Tax=Quercus suber TaxID=58331 RepID=A0AAW0INZ0_QUESU
MVATFCFSIDLSLPLCCGRLISLNNEKQLWVTFKEFRPSLHALPFAASRKSVINVPGYYPARKKTSPGSGGTFQATAEKDIDQPHPSVRTTAME